MWLIHRTTEIDSAHWLKEYSGKCSKIHGHRWKVEVFMLCTKVDVSGITVDFGEISEVINRYDHKLLNEMMLESPSAENISKRLYDELSIKCKDAVVKKIKVRVYETPDSYVEYPGEL